MNGGLEAMLVFQEGVVAMGIASDWSVTMGTYDGSSGLEEYFLIGGLWRMGVLVRDPGVRAV